MGDLTCNKFMSSESEILVAAFLELIFLVWVAVFWPARSKLGVGLCVPSEGLGRVSPRVVGIAPHCLHRAAKTTLSQQWKDYSGEGAHDLKTLLLGAAAHQSHVVDSPVRNSQESVMMDMCAATYKNGLLKSMLHSSFIFSCAIVRLFELMNQVHASLLKLVYELKHTTFFLGSASLNSHVDQRMGKFNKSVEITNRTLCRIGDESAASLMELESHFYSSTLSTSVPHEP